MNRTHAPFRRQVTLAVGAAVALLVVLVLPPAAADLYAPFPERFARTRSLSATLGPASPPAVSKLALVLVPAATPRLTGRAIATLAPPRHRAPLPALGTALTGAPAELHAVLPGGTLDRVACETLVEVAASRGLSVTWAGPREWGAPRGAAPRELAGVGTPGRADRLVAHFLSHLERPVGNLHLLVLPATGDMPADAARTDALLDALDARMSSPGRVALVAALGDSAAPLAVTGGIPPDGARRPPDAADALDLAPTAAALLGLPAPSASPGRPIARAFATPAPLLARIPRESADGARLLAALAADLGLDASGLDPAALVPADPLAPRPRPVRDLFERAFDKAEIGRRLLTRGMLAVLAVLFAVALFALRARGDLPCGVPAVLLYSATLLPVAGIAAGDLPFETLLAPSTLSGFAFLLPCLAFLYGLVWFAASCVLTLPSMKRGDLSAALAAFDAQLAPLAFGAATLAALFVQALLDAHLFAVRPYPDAAALSAYLVRLHALQGALLSLMFCSIVCLALLYVVSGRRGETGA